jgi:uncharacterized protein (TIGR00251 family)
MTRISVRLTPRSSQNEVLDFEGETLRVRVSAPPVDGRANAALERLLADRLGLTRGTVLVVAGHSGRQKVVEVEGLTETEIRSRLAQQRSRNR